MNISAYFASHLASSATLQVFLTNGKTYGTKRQLILAKDSFAYRCDPLPEWGLPLREAVGALIFQAQREMA